MWYTTGLTIRLLSYDTLSEYYRVQGVQSSCILLVYNVKFLSQSDQACLCKKLFYG